MTAARTILKLPVGEIAIGERIGFYEAAHAAQLGASMRNHGQHVPIQVRRNGNAAKRSWSLVAGLHRLRGAMEIGADTIDAIQVADATTSATDLRRIELSENLDHRVRRPIERAILMVERARLEEIVDYPDTAGEASQVRAGRARQSASLIVRDADWRDRTAIAMGCSVKSLERYQRIHRNIVEALPDLAQALNFHPLGEGLMGMIRLAQVKEVEGRRRVAEAILFDPNMPSVEEAIARINDGARKGDRELTVQNRLSASFSRTWAKMDISRKQASILDQIDSSPPTIIAFMVETLRQRGQIE